MTYNKTILFLGNKWFGTDCRMIVDSFRKKGYAVIEVDPYDYFPIRWDSFFLKVIRRFIRKLAIINYNEKVKSFSKNKIIEFVVVSKGVMLLPETITKFISAKKKVYCFYPDVSFQNQTKEVEACLPLYDCIFTTKSFHFDDKKITSSTKNLRLVRHGFDPLVNRKLILKNNSEYICDISFVGAWSKKKDRTMSFIIEQFPNLNIKIWGPGWHKASNLSFSAWQAKEVRGDELNIAYLSSTINMGILSEAPPNSFCGDNVTTRTWMIPACGAFMLHEDTDELKDYFQPNIEVAVYDGLKQLKQKIDLYLMDNDLRSSIVKSSYEKCLSHDFTYDFAVSEIYKYHKDNN
jgi:spore maturation protein CgeB